MMTSAQLLSALGGVDDALLIRCDQAAERRRHPWLRPALAGAACLALLLSVRLLAPAPPAPPPPDIEGEVHHLHLNGGDTGAFHLLQIQYGPAEAAVPDFILYVNPERYRTVQADGVYTVEPLSSPEGLPACDLRITHLANTSLSAAAETAAAELAATYASVSQITASPRAEGLLCTGSDGTAWDDAQAEVHLVDDGQGGVFRLTARYFLEAAEGHGARFADMIATFQVLPPGIRPPAWLAELRETVERLIPAVLSDDLSGAADLLAEGALVEGCGEDIWPDVSVQAIDYTVDDDQAPASAVVSVRYRLGAEDAADFLTLEFSRRDGRWLATWGGLEK